MSVVFCGRVHGVLKVRRNFTDSMHRNQTQPGAESDKPANGLHSTVRVDELPSLAIALWAIFKMAFGDPGCFRAIGRLVTIQNGAGANCQLDASDGCSRTYVSSTT